MRRLTYAVVAAGALAVVLRSAGTPPAYSGKEWAAPGGDWAATRYSTLAQIDAANVKTLGGAWVADLPDRQTSKAPLLVKDGRMFVTTTAGQILALDPATGKSLWTFKPETPFGGSRGIGIGDGLLFAGLRDSTVIAVSQQTGEVVWRHAREAGIPGAGDQHALPHTATASWWRSSRAATISPAAARSASTRRPARTCGTSRWCRGPANQVTTPGRRTTTSGSTAAAPSGRSPSVDADLGLVYLETGNAVPQWGGELRPGDNLFDNSVVALELKSGKMRWYYQLVHHDIWEHDVGTPLVLYDTTIGGRPRKVLMAMRTDGVPFFLDRETGKPVLPVEERPVKQDAFLKTSPTQPFTAGADRRRARVRRQEHDSARASRPAATSIRFAWTCRTTTCRT